MIKSYLKYKLKYGYFFKKRLKKIQGYYEMSQSDQDEVESQKLIRLVNNAYKKSAFYRELYDKHGINIKQIQNRDDLKKLPVITKNDIKNRVDEIYFGGKIKYTTFTSGTSGSPLKIYYSLDCILNEASYNEIFRNNAGHQIGQRVVSLRGNLDRTQFKSFDKFSNTLYLSSYNLNTKTFEFYYKQIKYFQPNAMLAYPSTFESLANYLIESDLELNIPVVFTSSETLQGFQREKIEKALNTRIYDRYGNAERTISLVQEEHNSDYKEASLYSVNEYRKDKIITTNLISPNFPLIRYEVDDVVELRNTDRVSVKEIIGRSDDVLLLPDGTKIARMNRIFSNVNNIKFTQIIQDKVAFFTVNIVKMSGFSLKDEQELTKNIRSRVGEKINFELKFINENDLIKTKRGKYKLVINTVK